MNVSPSTATPILGYCTNIHPGTDVASILDTLGSVSATVRNQFYADEADAKGRPSDTLLPVGLWLSAAATHEIRRTSVQPLADCLRDNKLLAYTFNGFPYDNFHRDRVKHDVYQPTWWQDERVGFTRDLAKILSELLPETITLGTISTLPLGWSKQPIEESGFEETGEADSAGMRDVSEDELLHAGTNLRRVAEDLRMLEDRTGKRIVLAIEPEPGCLLDRSLDIVDWFEQQLPDPTHRKYIGVCHDVCHSAVMMESQQEVLQRYARAGIQVAKVQISSAISVDWTEISASGRAAAIAQLREFAEDRYLHQTGRRDQGGTFSLCEDLPELLDAFEQDPEAYQNDQRWAVHFHVPIFLERFGQLATTRGQLLETLDAITKLSDPTGSEPSLQFTGHLEVETYAWSVLPASARRSDLSGDIASELTWMKEQLSQRA